MKIIVLDLQGFSIPMFTPKELTIFYNTDKFHHFLFKPMKPKGTVAAYFQRQIRYLENHHHCLKYGDGFVDYDQIEKIFQRLIIDEEVDIIYVKGDVKKQYLEQKLCVDMGQQRIHIVDLDSNSILKPIPVPSLKKQIVTQCSYHNTRKPCSCSLHNCIILYKYLIDVFGLT